MCLHEDARTDYNDEPGTDLELAKVIIRKYALHATIKNCTTYLSNNLSSGRQEKFLSLRIISPSKFSSPP